MENRLISQNLLMRQRGAAKSTINIGSGQRFRELETLVREYQVQFQSLSRL